MHYHAGGRGDDSPALVGVVVPKKQVPLATRRNRVKRRVRALMAQRSVPWNRELASSCADWRVPTAPTAAPWDVTWIGLRGAGAGSVKLKGTGGGAGRLRVSD